MIWTSLIAQGKRRLWMSLFVATLLTLIYVHFARFYQGRVSSWVLVVFGIPVAANLLRAGLGLLYRLEQHPFRALDLGLRSDQVPPGGALEVELVLEARRSAVLRRLDVELRASRSKSVGTGRQVDVIHSETRSLERDLELEPGLERSYPAELAIPVEAPYSFRSMEGKILWSIRVEVEVEGWGELRDEIEVTVAPA